MFSLLNKLLIVLVRSYRCCVSPLLVALFPMLGCRFQPTCSVYALEALQRHGPFRGTWLALKRLARCHPWGGCGPDPVPPPRPDGRLAPATPTPTAAASPALGCSATAQGGHECHQHSASLATSLP